MKLMTMILMQKKDAMWNSEVSQRPFEFMKLEGGTQECEVGADDYFKKLIRSADKNQDKYALETMMSRNNMNLRYI